MFDKISRKELEYILQTVLDSSLHSAVLARASVNGVYRFDDILGHLKRRIQAAVDAKSTEFLFSCEGDERAVPYLIDELNRLGYAAVVVTDEKSKYSKLRISFGDKK